MFEEKLNKFIEKAQKAKEERKFLSIKELLKKFSKEERAVVIRELNERNLLKVFKI